MSINVESLIIFGRALTPRLKCPSHPLQDEPALPPAEGLGKIKQKFLTTFLSVGYYYRHVHLNLW